MPASSANASSAVRVNGVLKVQTSDDVCSGAIQKGCESGSRAKAATTGSIPPFVLHFRSKSLALDDSDQFGPDSDRVTIP